MRLLALALVAVAFVPAASAGSGAFLTPDQLSNHADPSVLRTKNGVLAAYAVEASGSVIVTDGVVTHSVVSGWPAVSDPQLVQKADGTLYVYFGGSTPDLKTQGALRFASIDGGATWSGPVKTNAASTIGDVQAAALRRDFTPLFSQDGTGFINVYQGDNGATLHNDFNLCCGYYESLAVDTAGLAQLGFWSNATGKSGYMYEALDDSGGATAAPVNLAAGTDAQAQPAFNRVPLVADGAGNTFMAWPGEHHVTVAALGAGKLRRKFAIRTAGAPSQLALAVEPDGGKLWIVWTEGKYLWATRLRDAAHAAAPIVVRTPLPAARTAYAMEAIGLAGRVEAVVNVSGSPGNTLWQTSLIPGLAAHASRQPKPTVKVRDDIAPVKGATIRSGGKIAHTNAKGVASLKGFKRHSRATVTKAGYVGASFRVP
ncbi:MAG TPA: sialidase family protein [Gaiellaceae bacterium]|nr:sialidase family protein [Gaiellaceae bacterium]